MTYRALARAVAALHVAFVLFVVLGSLLVLRWPSLLWLHVAGVAWAAATLAFDLGCPLTPWEKSLWRRGGREPYPEGFLQHHVLRSFVSAEHSRRNHIVLGIGALVLNIAVYFFVLSS
jgi:uncharacterized membrane protein YedE/YeeE